jgi:hypothetical protein
MYTPVYFSVPFAQKDRAKACGGRWNPTHRFWFAANPEAEAALKAHFRVVDLGAATAPLVLIGEDRDFGGQNGGKSLFVDLVPRSCWFTNVRYCIEPDDWQRLSRTVRARANHKCEVCGAAEEPAQKAYLEAHERWAFDEDTNTQTLKRIIALCHRCHRTTHWGLAQLQGEEDVVNAHLRSVNNWTDEQVDDHVAEAFELWAQRSGKSWALDLSLITNSGLTLVRPVAKGERAAIAEGKLESVRTNNTGDD